MIALSWIDRFLWRTPRQRAARFARFAGVERSSATDLRLAARACASPDRAVLYLRHARDELRHTQLFFAAAQAISDTHQLAPPTPPSAACEALFELLGERDFLAFVHLGERRGRAQFELHAGTHERAGRTELSAMLRAIIADEVHHERYTYRLLVEITGSERAAHARIRRMQLWEALRGFRRLAQRNASSLFSVGAGALYVVLVPVRFMLPAPRARALTPPERT